MHTIRMGLAWFRHWGWGAGFTAVLLLLLAQPAQALHQRKVGVGVGTASSSIAGDLDGQAGYTAPGTVVLSAKPDPGSGVNLYVGVTINPFFGLEVLAVSTKHDATHQAAPGQPMTAQVTTVLLGGRLMLPMGDSFEVFARAGLGSGVVNYTGNAVVNGSITDSTFSGGALGFGGGVAVYFEPVSVELSMLNQSITLNTLSAGSTSGAISDAKLTANTVLLTVMVHFGDP